ncbi:Protein Zgrf1 [Manis pentadactyla]|nr:Protein Zgrf1 [Manis pentadactyla]
MLVPRLSGTLAAIGIANQEIRVVERPPGMQRSSMAWHCSGPAPVLCTYWNQGYSYQQGYEPGYGSSDDSPHGYYGYGPGYYYRFLGMYSRLLGTYNRVGPYEDAAGS